MNGKSGSEAARDDCGRFSGARFDVEQIPRLPTFPARWALDDPRGRPSCSGRPKEARSVIRSECSASTAEKR